MSIKRREFLARARGVLAASRALGSRAETAPTESAPAHDAHTVPTDRKTSPGASCGAARDFNGSYQGQYQEHIAFPMGGIGAGMICLEGAGSLSQLSLRYRIDSAREPGLFAAISIK